MSHTLPLLELSISRQPHFYVWSFCGCIFVLYGYNGEISLQMKGRQC